LPICRSIFSNFLQNLEGKFIKSSNKSKALIYYPTGCLRRQCTPDLFISSYPHRTDLADTCGNPPWSSQRQCLSLHTDTTPPQPNHNVTPPHIEPDTTHEITQHISRKLLRMDVLTSETCRALNKEIIKQVTSRWSLFTQLLR